MIFGFRWTSLIWICIAFKGIRSIQIYIVLRQIHAIYKAPYWTIVSSIRICSQWHTFYPIFILFKSTKQKKKLKRTRTKEATIRHSIDNILWSNQNKSLNNLTLRSRVKCIFIRLLKHSAILICVLDLNFDHKMCWVRRFDKNALQEQNFLLTV